MEFAWRRKEVAERGIAVPFGHCPEDSGPHFAVLVSNPGVLTPDMSKY